MQLLTQMTDFEENFQHYSWRKKALKLERGSLFFNYVYVCPLVGLVCGLMTLFCIILTLSWSKYRCLLLLFTINNSSNYSKKYNISGFILFLFIQIYRQSFWPIFFPGGRYRHCWKYMISSADIVGYLELLCSLAIVIRCEIRLKTLVTFT